ncbi:MAG: prephenate dehydrogenase [Clostridia bacterium]|nr:prephenate dehydrogenase [Clostridia bacterium]
MNIGIVGLGLIGGSFARVLKQNDNNKIFAADVNRSAYLAACMTGSCDDELTADNIGLCDYILVCAYPEASVNYIIENKNRFKKGAVVIDCCGVKRDICKRLNPLNEKNDFIFVGGHPMAGTQQWGFNHSRASLFSGASMILTPDSTVEISILEKIKAFFLDCGFGTVVFTSPEEHDKIIAFTSQLPHIISNAYVKSPSALQHKGFSAGSYKDMSRVAKLNGNLWGELFLKNSDYLIDELDIFIEHLTEYRDALKNSNEKELSQLLTDGSECKSKAK